MAFEGPQITIRKGGLNRRAGGEDHISALVFAGAAPAAFDAAAGLAVRSVREAEARGVTGVGARALEHYHVTEFFRMAPGATLYLCYGLTDIPAQLRALTGGKLRQWGAVATDTTTVQSVYQAHVSTMAAASCPTVCVVAIDGAAVTAVNALPDLGTFVAPQVSVVVCGSGAGRAEALRVSLGLTYVPALGTALGTIAGAAVHHSIGWVDRYNLSDGQEFETVRFCDGNLDVIGAAADALGDKQYLVAGEMVDYEGRYWDSSATAVVRSDDYATINNNRVIQKATRLVRRALMPQVNAPALVDPTTGRLDATTIANLEAIGEAALRPMAGDREVSGYRVLVDAEQDVLATSEVGVEIEIVPVGTAKTLKVFLGLVRTLSA